MFENRLTPVTLPGGGETVTFKYDPFGRRIQRSGPAGVTNYRSAARLLVRLRGDVVQYDATTYAAIH